MIFSLSARRSDTARSRCSSQNTARLLARSSNGWSGVWSSVSRVARILVVAGSVAAFSGGVLVPASSVSGQGMMGMRGGGMGGGVQGVSKQSVDAYARILKLDESQKEAVGMLADGFRGSLKAIEKDMEGKFNKLQEDAQEEGWGVYQKEMPKIIKDMNERQEASQKQFIDDIKSLLTPEQLEEFPSIERHRRRDTLLRMGMVSGAGVDIWSIHDRLNARESVVPAENAQQVTGVMDRYEVDMDRLLQDMERMYKEDIRKFTEGDQSMMDPTKMLDRLKPYAEVGTRIRDANRDAARKLEPLYTQEAQAKFRNEINTRAYPRIYRKGTTAKIFDSAVKIEDLDVTQKEQVTALKTQYERDIVSLNEAWAKATDAAEAESGGTFGVMMQGFGGGGGNKELGDARKARREADKAAKEKLMEVLSPDQQKQLPSDDSLRENPWEAMMPVADEE